MYYGGVVDQTRAKWPAAPQREHLKAKAGHCPPGNSTENNWSAGG